MRWESGYQAHSSGDGQGSEKQLCTSSHGLKAWDPCFCGKWCWTHWSFSSARPNILHTHLPIKYFCSSMTCVHSVAASSWQPGSISSTGLPYIIYTLAKRDSLHFVFAFQDLCKVLKAAVANQSQIEVSHSSQANQLNNATTCYCSYLSPLASICSPCRLIYLMLGKFCRLLPSFPNPTDVILELPDSFSVVKAHFPDIYSSLNRSIVSSPMSCPSRFSQSG